MSVFCCGFVAAQTPNNVPETDNQFWNETQVVFWSDEKNESAVNFWFRAGREGLLPTDARIGFSHTYKTSKYLSLSGGYLYRYGEPVRNSKNYESRFIAAATVNLPLKYKFKLADRNQYEYKMRNSRRDTWDYRNRLRIDREITVKGKKVSPFAFAEVFYNERDSWYRTRFAIGINKKFNEKFTGEIFYLRQNDGINKPGDFNVLGTYFKINL
jgi:hypothetical protein